MDMTTAGAQAALAEAQREIEETLSRLASKLGDAYALDADVEVREWRGPCIRLIASLRAGASP